MLFSDWTQKFQVNDDDALARSRAAARQLLHVATQRTPSTLIEARFVAPGGKLESDLLVFSQGGPLRLALRKELLSYGSVLLVLKTLEAKHFAIGIRARAGRAASVHAISADMRRQVNRDLLSDKFDECFPQLLDQLGELTTLPWQNKVQLLEIISKQFHRDLHACMESQKSCFERFRAYLKKQRDDAFPSVPRTGEYTLRFHHLLGLVEEYGYYALPFGEDDLENGTMTVFQVLALGPGQRQYLQRSAYMTVDALHLPMSRFCSIGSKFEG